MFLPKVIATFVAGPRTVTNILGLMLRAIAAAQILFQLAAKFFLKFW